MSTNSCLTPQGVDLKWLEEKLPYIPVNLLDDVVQIAHRHGVEAVGAFYNGIIELAKNSPRGTEYHEAGHAVFWSYLSPEQRDRLLNEASKEAKLERSFDEKQGIVGGSKFKESNSVNYTLKSVEILQSDKAKQVFDKGKKANWDLNKILTELQIPKEQKQLILDLGITDREQLSLELASNYSYTVEINTAKQTASNNWDGEQMLDDSPYNTGEENTQHYSNLTVPGGTNYTENEIYTPAITPSIKGHAQFSTDNGIGWFRSDEQVTGGQVYQQEEDDYGPSILATYDGESTKTRRILEVQSDLFQKGRNKEDLTDTSNNFKEKLVGNFEGEAVYNLEEDKSSNQFLQFLNKDNNWVTFFVKSIIQDSAKKGYEKVLFPTGNTASKVEGHTTLEEFELDKRSRLNHLQTLKEGDKFTDRDGYIFSKIDGEYYRKQAYSSSADKISKEWYLESFNEYTKNIDIEINQLKQELERVEIEGFGALKPIYNFYENTVTNILKKQGYNPTLITDEYGNTWQELTITDKIKSDIIKLKSTSESAYKTNDDKLEEHIMNGMENFMKHKIPSKSRFIQDFYNKIKFWIKEKLGLLKIHDLYSGIDNGYFKNKKPLPFSGERFKKVLELKDHKELYEKFKLLNNKGEIRYVKYNTPEEIADVNRQLDSLNRSPYYKFEVLKTPTGYKIFILDKGVRFKEISNSEIKISNTLKEFLEPFFNSQDENIVEPFAKNLTNSDKEILTKAIGRTYKNINDFDWYEAIWSDIGQEEVFYYLKTGNQLEKDILENYYKSKLYNDWQNFVKENKEFVDNFNNLPENIQKDLQKDYNKLKEKNEWYKFELSNLEYDIRKKLLKNEGYIESKISVDTLDKKDVNINNSSNQVTPQKNYSKVSDISDSDKIELVNSGTYITMFDLMKEQGVNNPYYLDLSKLNQTDLVQKVRKSFEKLYNTKGKLPQESHYLIDKIIEPKNLQFLVKRTLKELQNKTTMVFDVEDDLLLEENISEEIYEKSKFKVNPTEKFATEFNMLLGSLTKREVIDGSLVIIPNKLGLPQYLSRSEVLNDLFRDTSNINDLDAMIKVLESKINQKPHYNELLDYIITIKKSITIKGNIYNYNSFENTFFSNLNLYYNQFVTGTTEIKNKIKEEIIKLPDGSDYVKKVKIKTITARTSDTNTQGVNNPLLQEFKSLFNSNTTIEDIKSLAKTGYLLDSNGKYVDNATYNDKQKDQLRNEIDKRFNIKLSKETVDYFFQETGYKKLKEAPYKAYVYKNIPVLFNALEELVSANENKVGTTSNLKALAAKESEVRKLDNFTLTDKSGAKFFAIGQYTATKKLVTNIKQKGSDYLNTLTVDRMYMNNPIIKGDSKVQTFESDNIVVDGDNTSKAYQEMNSLEWEKTCLEMYHNNTTVENGNFHGSLPFITPSDASNIEVRSIIKRDNLVTSDGNNLNVSTLNNVLYNSHILPELKRIKKVREINNYIAFLNTQLKASKDIDEKRALIKEIKSLTVKEWNKQGESFVMFPELNPLIDTLLTKYGSYLEGKDEIFDNQSPISGQIIAEISPILSKTSLNNLQKDYNYLQEIGLINKEGRLNQNIVSDSARNYLKSTPHIYNYLANRWISNLECTVLQVGDLAFYKSYDDTNKRAKEGQVPVRSAVPQKYKVVFTESLNKQSQFYEAYKNIIGEELADGYKLKVEKNKGIDTTDAATFCTMERVIQILNAKGKDGKKAMEAIKRITENTGLDYSEDLNFVIQSLKTFTFAHMPVEMKYKVQDSEGNFTVEKTSTTVVPTQIKHAVIPLIPAFIENHPQLKLLNDKMVKEDIGEWIFDSATKVGTRNLVSKEEASEWLKDETGSITLSTVELDMEHWGEVLDVPYKNTTSEKLSSQKMRKAMENIEPTDTYNVNWSKKPITGQELIDHYNKAIDSVLRSQFETLEDKMFTNGILDIEKFKTHLKGLIEANDPNSFTQYWDNVLEELNENNLHILDTPFNKNKIYSLLASNFNKEVLDIEITGKSAVLASTYGLQGDGIDIIDLASNLDGTLHAAQLYNEFTDINDVKANLTHIQREFNRLGMNVPQDEIQALEALKTTPIVTADEIIVTPAYFIKSLKKKGIDPTIFMDDKGNMNVESIPEELRFVSFHRIPYQDKNSNSKAYIKSFSNVSSGTVIYFSPDILVRSGGDFDIDKVYIEFYDYSLKYGSLLEELKNQGVGLPREYTNEVISEMIQLEDEELTPQKLEIKRRLENFEKPFLGIKKKDTNKNKIIDSHLAVASSPHHYKELVTPNNAEGIRTIRNDLAKGKQKTVTPWYSVKKQGEYRAANKACKDLIGIYSVMNVFHGIAQQIKPKFKAGYGVFIEGYELTKFGEKEDLEGNLISDNNQQMGTAAVDGVKDPMLGDLNHSVFSAPLKGMLNLSKLGKTRLEKYTNNPMYIAVGRYYDEYSLTESSSKATRKAFEQVAKDFNIKDFAWSYVNDFYTTKAIDSKGKTFDKKSDILLRDFVKQNNTTGINTLTDVSSNMLYSLMYHHQLASKTSDFIQGSRLSNSGIKNNIAENVLNLNKNEEYFLESEFIEFDQNVLNTHWLGTYNRLMQGDFRSLLNNVNTYHTPFYEKTFEKAKQYGISLNNRNQVETFYRALDTFIILNDNYKLRDTYKSTTIKKGEFLKQFPKLFFDRYVKDNVEKNYFLDNLQLGKDFSGMSDLRFKWNDDLYFDQVVEGATDFYNKHPEAAKRLFGYSLKKYGFGMSKLNPLKYMEAVYQDLNVDENYRKDYVVIKNAQDETDFPLWFDMDSFLFQYAMNNPSYVKKAYKEDFQEGLNNLNGTIYLIQNLQEIAIQEAFDKSQGNNNYVSNVPVDQIKLEKEEGCYWG